MSRQQVYRRAVQRHTGFDFAKQMQGLTPQESAFADSAMEGDWIRFLQVGDSNPSLRQVCHEIRRFARDGGAFVIIDHLHILVNSSDRNAITEATRALKMAANDSSLNPKGGVDRRPVVFLLSQFTRLEKRDDGSFRPPSIQSFKESGSIEADADIAILLHRFDRKLDTKVRDGLEKQGFILAHDRQKGTTPFKDLCHIEVAKNRYGTTDRYPAWFDGADQAWSLLDQRTDNR
jgi:replicative DNA helicase